MILKLKNIEKLIFIGYKDDEYKIKPLCIILPKTSAYKKYGDGTKCVSFLMEDNKLLKKDSKIWDKISNRIRELEKNLIANQL